MLEHRWQLPLVRLQDSPRGSILSALAKAQIKKREMDGSPDSANEKKVDDRGVVLALKAFVAPSAHTEAQAAGNAEIDLLGKGVRGAFGAH